MKLSYQRACLLLWGIVLLAAKIPFDTMGSTMIPKWKCSVQILEVIIILKKLKWLVMNAMLT